MQYSTQQALDMLSKLTPEIEKTLKELNENVYIENNENPNEIYLFHNVHSLSTTFNFILEKINYLQQPIIAEGPLLLGENGRYSIDGRYELNDGDNIEFLSGSESQERERWAATKVIYTDGEYKFQFYSNEISEGTIVRIR